MTKDTTEQKEKPEEKKPDVKTQTKTSCGCLPPVKKTK